MVLKTTQQNELMKAPLLNASLVHGLLAHLALGTRASPEAEPHPF